jgi:hypothetical protein
VQGIAASHRTDLKDVVAPSTRTSGLAAAVSSRATDQQRSAAHELARRLERDGTPVELAVDELLSQFAIRRLTLYARERIQEAFDAAGLLATPDLREVKRGGRLVVSSAAARPDPPTSGSHSDGATSGHPPAFGGGRRWLLPATAVGRSVLGIAVAAVIGALALEFFDSDRVAGWVAWHAGKLTLTGTPSSCRDPGYLREIEIDSASAFYQQPGHLAGQSIDDDSTTAWIETLRRNGDDLIAWSVGSGAPRVRLICIRNGWARDIATNSGVGRLARVTLSGARQKKELRGKGCRKTVKLPKRPADEFGAFESIPFDCAATIVRLHVESIHPGTGDPDDVALSDVRLYG